MHGSPPASLDDAATQPLIPQPGGGPASGLGSGRLSSTATPRVDCSPGCPAPVASMSPALQGGGMSITRTRARTDSRVLRGLLLLAATLLCCLASPTPAATAA